MGLYRWVVRWLVLFAAGLMPCVGYSQTFASAMSQCSGYCANIGDTHQCLVTSSTSSGGNIGCYYCVNTGCKFSGGWGFQRVCTANVTTSGPGGIESAVPLSPGMTTCDANYCEAHFNNPSDGPGVCFTYNGVTTCQYERGYNVSTGNTCPSQSSPQPNPAPDPDPKMCDPNTQVCYQKPKQFCATLGGQTYCVPAPNPTTSSDSSGPKPTPDPPTPCAMGPNAALCSGNPPPDPPPPVLPPDQPPPNPSPNPPPPPPPTGCGSGATSKSAVYSINGVGTTAVVWNCPPPNTGEKCGPGTIDNGQGSCVPQCGQGQVYRNGSCTDLCNPGQALLNGQCQTICPSGTVMNGTRCDSTCSDGKVAVNGVCGTNCPVGSTAQRDGSCKAGCTAGQVLQGSSCVGTCTSGYTVDSNGLCQPSNCTNGQLAMNGVCQDKCTQGYVQNGKQCVPGNSASGGNTCGSPPTCTGDQVLCNIDWQAWAHRCGFGNSAKGGADCSAQPTCTGDPIACDTRLQIWLSRCPQVPQDDTQAKFDALTETGSVSDFDASGMASGLDSTGFLGGGGACVHFDPIQLFYGSINQTVDINNSSWCYVQSLLRGLILMFAYFRAAQIFMKG